MSKKAMPKRVLKDIVIDEISAVDKPAQPGAVSTIMKRFDPKKEGLAKKNNPVHKQNKNCLLYTSPSPRD